MLIFVMKFYTYPNKDINMVRYMRMYSKVSGLAAWRENCKCYSFLPLGGSCIAIL
jgi:hypothetical protein